MSLLGAGPFGDRRGSMRLQRFPGEGFHVFQMRLGHGIQIILFQGCVYTLQDLIEIGAGQRNGVWWDFRVV